MNLVGKHHPLTTRKRDTGHAYRLAITEYPSGDVEVNAIKFEPDTHLGNTSKKVRKNEKKSEMDEETLRKSQRRSSKQVLKKSLTMQADRMITLTFRENLTDLNEAWTIFKYFTKLMRWRFGERFIYIVVPEFQKRGAVHFHLAVKGFYHENILKKFWTRAVGQLGGNVDITSPRRYNFNSWNPKRIARYLAKYITKNETVDFNSRRYASTKTLKPPVPIIEWLALGVPVIGVMNDIIKEITHMPILTVWESDKYYQITYLST